MELRQLRAIIAIADTGSVTKAAECLNVVQPAISRQVRLLEEELGKSIFERTPQGMRLTEEGNLLIQSARRALLAIDQVVSEIRQRPSSVSGIVAVGLLPSTCDLIAGDLVTIIKQQYPAVRLRLCTGYAGQLQEWVERDEIDIALLYDPRDRRTIEVRPLLDEPLFLVGPRDIGITWGEYEPLSTLAGLPLIMPAGSHSVRGIVEQACTSAGISLNIVAEADDTPLTRALLMSEVGYTVLAGIAIADELLGNSVGAVPLGKPILQRRVVVALGNSGRNNESVKCVADVLTGRVKSFVRQGRWPGARLVDFE